MSLAEAVMERSTCVHLPERVTQAEAPSVLARLHASALADPRADATLVVDASRLRSFDSAVLAVLLELRRWALERRCRLRVDGAPQALQRLAHLYGVAALLGWPDPEEPLVGAAGQ